MPRGTPFQAGNKFGRGRPPGSRNKSTLLKQGALEAHATPLLNKLMLMALNGQIGAMRLCMEQLMPGRHSAPVKLRMPKTNTAAGVKEGCERVLQGVAKGEISPTQGLQLMTMLDVQRRAVESDELEQRLEAVENHMKEGGAK